MAYLLPSTSFSSCHGAGQHDVFLSFRGIDTRNNFTSHLYRALHQKGIQTFIDNEELRRGEEISTSLITAIKESKISIIIFSENYASSSWCLDELVEIFKCRESLRQLVWPIFLYVDPSDVRNHRGSFGEALAQYEESSDKKKEKLPEWKIALNKAANLSGWHLANGDESQLIQRIVEAALSKLNRTLLHVAKYPVGIESHLHQLASLIHVGEKDVRFIGIHGIGGIGKTTIAKAAFNSFADEFEGSSFLADVRETSKQHFGFVQLQEVLLFDMLGDRNLKVGNIHRGINIIKERLCNKRVLLILDDVDELDQLETLAGGHDWFGSGSRIIITSRNKHLLTTHEVKRTYEVPKLNYSEAVDLFSWNAFKREELVESYRTLSHRIVHYASGLPLALVILGSFLCGRKEDQWQSAIHNLKKKPDKKLYQILKISYDSLQDDEKTLFLDIACFFVGKDKNYVTQVLGSSNFCPIIGIRVLSDMSLINVEQNKLRMHNLIEEMGKEIVRQESPEAGKRSRLWSPDDIFHVLSENTGTDSIEGIMLKLPEQRTLHLNAKSFERMKRLRLLIFNTRKWDTPAQEIGDFLDKIVAERGFGLLRVLDLGKVYKPKLQEETLEKLFSLAYLGLRWTFLDSLPDSVGALQYLETLDVKHTNITTLPITIWKAKRLRHLYMNQVHFDMSNKNGFTNSLTNLQTLWGLSIGRNSLVVKWLSKLSSLRKLGLTYVYHPKTAEEIANWVSKLTNLQSLRLRSFDEFGQPSHLKLPDMTVLDKLSELYLVGVLSNVNSIFEIKFPPKLEILTLSGSQLWNAELLQTLGQLSDLKSIKFYGHSYSGDQIIIHTNQFPQLAVIKLWVLEKLEVLEIKGGAMPNLKELDIRSCHNLKAIKGLKQLAGGLRTMTLTSMPADFVEKVRSEVDENQSAVYSSTCLHIQDVIN